jgi:UDP-3-O-[3-hydroxymyristoyl] glucosamine N-acyltransferase
MAATTAAALAELVRGAVRGDGNRPITGAAGLDQAGPQDVTYLVDVKHLPALKTTKAGVCIVGKTSAAAPQDSTTGPVLIVVEDALDAFLLALQEFRPQASRPPRGISPQAHVSPTAQCGVDCSIQAGAFVADGAQIGAGCDIYPGVYIGPDCRIGANCVLYPNVVLYWGVVLQDRVVVHSGAVLGADGFGYRFREGRFEKIPQLGWVEVQEDCEIGANTTVDRGMIGATVLGRGTKLDNLVMIGHNCRIGRHNAFASQVGLAGSVTTGDYVRMAGQVGVADHVHIGQAAVLGAKAGVHNDLAAAQSYLGAPARPEAEAIRILMTQNKLPDMRKQLREMEKQVAELQKQVEMLSLTRMAS